MPVSHEDRQEDLTNSMSHFDRLMDRRKLAYFNILFSMNMMYVLPTDSSKIIPVALIIFMQNWTVSKHLVDM